jgi:hypothetical protein
MIVPDLIRDSIYREAMRRHEDAASLSFLVGGEITPEHIDRYLTGRCGMLTAKAGKLLKVLGLTNITKGKT